MAQNEVHVYTWKDSTLRELSDLIKEGLEEARAKDAELLFQAVFCDFNGVPKMKDLGKVNSWSPGESDDLTLEQLQFIPGDFMALTVYNTNSN